MVVTAVAGGYLAGRVDLVPTDSPLHGIELPMPAARDAEAIRPAPTPEVPAPPRDRSHHFAGNRAAANGPSSPAAEPSSTPPDSTAPSSVRESEKRDAVSSPRIESAAAMPATPRPAAVSERVEEPPPVVVQAATPSAPSPTPQLASTSKPVPTAEPRVERVPVASDASARRQSSPPEEPASDPAADDGQSVANGSVTAIVVGARGAAEPGARAVAYVRVQVQLEPGSTLTIDGERVGVAPFSDLIMEPGLHTFVAELPDGLQIEQLIQVKSDTGVVEF